MAQVFRALLVLTGDFGLLSRTHSRQLTPVYNVSSREDQSPLLVSVGMCMHNSTHKHTKTHRIFPFCPTKNVTALSVKNKRHILSRGMVLTHPSGMRNPLLGPWWDSTLLISYTNFYEELQERKVDTKIDFQKNRCPCRKHGSTGNSPLCWQPRCTPWPVRWHVCDLVLRGYYRQHSKDDVPFSLWEVLL